MEVNKIIQGSSQRIDLMGQKFGRLTVIKRVESTFSRRVKWLCRCDCGKEIIVKGKGLRSGHTKSCGCIRITDLTGKKFGRWTVIKRVNPFSRVNGYKWLCKCDCGTIRKVRGLGLRNGTSTSCGCYHKEIAGLSNKLDSGIASFRRKYHHYKSRSREIGRKWELTEEQFKKITQKDCYYCGAKPNNRCGNKSGNGDYIYNGIDRVNNEKGYTIDNIVPCCKICNLGKRDLTVSEFKDWIGRVYNKMFIKEISF